MKKFVIAISAIAAVTAIARPASTKWTPQPQQHHRHCVGYRCPHCGQAWGAIPPGIKAWEVRHLISEQKKLIALHMRLRHSAVK